MEITIECEDQSINFELEEPFITLQSLKRYFPTAAGLTYSKNGKNYCILPAGERFELKPEHTTYQAFCSTGMHLN